MTDYKIIQTINGPEDVKKLSMRHGQHHTVTSIANSSALVIALLPG